MHKNANINRIRTRIDRSHTTWDISNIYSDIHLSHPKPIQKNDPVQTTQYRRFIQTSQYQSSNIGSVLEHLDHTSYVYNMYVHKSYKKIVYCESSPRWDMINEHVASSACILVHTVLYILLFNLSSMTPCSSKSLYIFCKTIKTIHKPYITNFKQDGRTFRRLLWWWWTSRRIGVDVELICHSTKLRWESTVPNTTARKVLKSTARLWPETEAYCIIRLLVDKFCYESRMTLVIESFKSGGLLNF